MGAPQISFGDFDAGEGRLGEPQRLFVSNAGKIYVSDHQNGEIIVFDVHGNYLHQFGEGRLDFPAGLTQDRENHILVADRGARKVWIFNDSGIVLGYVDLAEVVEEPVDVAVWKDRLYILDKKQHRVVVVHWIQDREISPK